MHTLIIQAACYLAGSFLLGCTVTALVYRSRFTDLHKDFLAACEDAARHLANRDYWRHEAEIVARDLQELRTKVPARDPKTNKFVKRAA